MPGLRVRGLLRDGKAVACGSGGNDKRDQGGAVVAGKKLSLDSAGNAMNFIYHTGMVLCKLALLVAVVEFVYWYKRWREGKR